LAESRSAADHELEPQARLEQRPLVRYLLSVLVVFALAAIVQSNLRPSYLKGKLGDVTIGYTNAVGLDQDWSLFAPEPRKFTLALAAEVKYADGSQRIWTLPRGDNVTGAYWDYRWRKWVEYAVDERHRELWAPAADWIARDAAKPGTTVVRVTLLRDETPNNPPGQKPAEGNPTQARYFSYVPELPR